MEEFAAAAETARLRAATEAEERANGAWRARAVVDLGVEAGLMPFPMVLTPEGKRTIDGPEHAAAGARSLCGLPEAELAVMRHLFRPGARNTCVVCSAAAVAGHD